MVAKLKCTSTSAMAKERFVAVYTNAVPGEFQRPPRKAAP
jgi:hypothetical protein